MFLINTFYARVWRQVKFVKYFQRVHGRKKKIKVIKVNFENLPNYTLNPSVFKKRMKVFVFFISFVYFDKAKPWLIALWKKDKRTYFQR